MKMSSSAQSVPPLQGSKPPACGRDRIVCTAWPEDHEHYDEDDTVDDDVSDNAADDADNDDVKGLTCPGQEPLHSWLPVHFPTLTIWKPNTYEKISHFDLSTFLS